MRCSIGSSPLRQHPPPPSCDNPATAPDCAVLLEARDNRLDVSIHHWWGVTVDRWTGRVIEVHPGETDRPDSSRPRPTPGGAAVARSSQPAHEIPSELGQLSDRDPLETTSSPARFRRSRSSAGSTLRVTGSRGASLRRGVSSGSTWALPRATPVCGTARTGGRLPTTQAKPRSSRNSMVSFAHSSGSSSWRKWVLSGRKS